MKPPEPNSLKKQMGHNPPLKKRLIPPKDISNQA
jgi:hypothetical protein